jgi:hypothetical protein
MFIVCPQMAISDVYGPPVSQYQEIIIIIFFISTHNGQTSWKAPALFLRMACAVCGDRKAWHLCTLACTSRVCLTSPDTFFTPEAQKKNLSYHDAVCISRCDSVDFSLEDPTHPTSFAQPDQASHMGYINNTPGSPHREAVEVDDVRPSRQCQNLGYHTQPRGIVHARPSSAVYRAQVAQRRAASGLTTRPDAPMMLNNIYESPSLKKKSAGFEAARLHSAVRGHTPFKHEEVQDSLRASSDRGENGGLGSELVSALEAERRKNLKLSSMLQAREKTYMMKELQNRCGFFCVCACL